MTPAIPAPRPADPGQARPLIAFGVVRHARLRPVRHAFAYRGYFLLLPMRSLGERPHAALARNRFGLIGFHDADHGDGRKDALAWLDELMLGEGIADAVGEIWLQTYPRVLGYVFKPVSFWYVHRPDDTLAAVVVEVNNTFGERHCYLLHGQGLAWGREVVASKAMHVSPFCQTGGRYRFRFMRTGQAAASSAHHRGATGHLVARIEHDDDAGALLQTSVSGALVPLDAASLRRAFWSMPLMSLFVMARIHWQALRLWTKRLPFVAKPPPPRAFVSR